MVRPENNNVTHRSLLQLHLNDRADLGILNKLSKTERGRRAKHGDIHYFVVCIAVKRVPVARHNTRLWIGLPPAR